MVVTQQSADVRRLVAEHRQRGERIGVVPTMGALHAGHLSLVEAARRECDFLVVTVFVNPAQFAPNEDFRDYPRPLEDDLAVCRRHGVDLVFQPDVQTVYPPGFATIVEVDGLSSVLEGAYRPGHFRGVATVVLKLLNIVTPDVAYFGQKDYQQQSLIRKLCRDLDLPVEIRTCPTIRDPDGLALSSRNSYLSPEERQQALVLSQSLRLAADRLQGGETDVSAVRTAMRECLEAMSGLRVDYATVADAHTLEELSEPRAEMVALVAAHIGRTRLIDNMPIHLSE